MLKSIIEYVQPERIIVSWRIRSCLAWSGSSALCMKMRVGKRHTMYYFLNWC